MTAVEKIEAIGQALLQFGLMAIPVVILVWGLASPSNVPDEEGLTQGLERAAKVLIGAVVALAALYMKIKDVWKAKALTATLNNRLIDLEIVQIQARIAEGHKRPDPWIDPETDRDVTSTNVEVGGNLGVGP